MPRLDTFTLEIRTGETRGPERPKFKINSFPLDFESLDGGTGPVEILTASGSSQSFPHSLMLCGPENGQWDIEGVTATYQCANDEPYTIRMGAVTLDDKSDLNIWHERPAPAFDV